MRERIRRQGLAEKFSVNVRTIDSWWKGNPKKPDKPKVLPPPHYLPGSPIPFWFEDEIPGNTTNNSEAA
jgi:hypothetical protein